MAKSLTQVWAVRGVEFALVSTFGAVYLAEDFDEYEPVLEQRLADAQGRGLNG